VKVQKYPSDGKKKLRSEKDDGVVTIGKEKTLLFRRTKGIYTSSDGVPEGRI